MSAQLSFAERIAQLAEIDATVVQDDGAWRFARLIITPQ